MKAAIKFAKPIGLGALIEAEKAWAEIATNDKLLRKGSITRDEWFRRRDALAAELKAKGL